MPTAVFTAPGPIEVMTASGLRATPEVGVRDVRGRLLVADLQEGRAVAAHEGVDHGQAAVARDAHHVGHAVGGQVVGDDLAAGARCCS